MEACYTIIRSDNLNAKWSLILGALNQHIAKLKVPERGN
jgi:hypothetical protein